MCRGTCDLDHGIDLDSVYAGDAAAKRRGHIVARTRSHDCPAVCRSVATLFTFFLEAREDGIG